MSNDKVMQLVYKCQNMIFLPPMADLWAALRLFRKCLGLNRKICNTRFARDN